MWVKGDATREWITKYCVKKKKKSPWRRKWQPAPVFLPGKSYGQKSLVGYSPWGPKDSDTAEQLNTNTNTQRSFPGG